MELRKRQNKEINWLGIIAILQILLIANSIPAESFVANRAFLGTPTANLNQRNNFGNFLKGNLGFLAGFLEIKQIGFVSATTLNGLRCCLETTSNAVCDNVGDTDDCKGNVFSTTCENTYECKVGTCVTDNGISCSVSSRESCGRTADAEWFDDTPANVPQCAKGCCIVGNNAHFETSAKCDLESGTFQSSVNTEAACILLSANILQGACVTDGGRCIFTTGSDCGQRSGSFFGGELCTNSQLKTDFGVINEPTSNTMLINGKDDIYWADSEGQPGNIYDASKTFALKPDYWENVQTPTCNLYNYNADGSINANDIIDEKKQLACGDCDRYFGTAADTKENAGINPTSGDGDYICRDLSCRVDENNDGVADYTKRNGETWCMYDGSIGNVSEEYEYKTYSGQDRKEKISFSSDTVGSEYFLGSCTNGKVDATPSYYRETVCQANGVGKDSTQASLVGNAAPACFSFNPLIDKDGDDIQDSIDKCNENLHCYVKKIDVDDYFKFKVCVPKYPTGFPKSDVPEETSPAESYCTIANTECTVVYQKNEQALTFQGGDEEWSCVKNCDCQTKEFAIKMNNLCISLGDCGSYINYAGNAGENNSEIEGKKGDSGKKPEKIPVVYDWTNYEGYESFTDKADSEKFISPPEPEQTTGDIGTVETGQNVEISDVDSSLLNSPLFKRLNENIGGQGGGTASNINSGDLLNGVGVGGAVILVLTKYYAASALFNQVVIFEGEFFAGLGEVEGFFEAQSSAVSPYAYAFIGAVIGAYAGAYLAKSLDVTGPAADLYILAGGTAGGTLTYAASATGATPYALAFGWGAVVVIAWMYASEVGKTETRKIQFTCLPWEAPTNVPANECEKCNGNPLKECTQYRCESLGKNCKLLNGNLQGDAITDKPVCKSLVYESNPPQIFKGDINLFPLTEGYVFANDVKGASIDIQSSREDKCIPDGTPVQFTLQTDEFSTCKWDYKSTATFDEMENTIAGGAFQGNHTLVTEGLSFSLLNAFEITGLVGRQTGDITMNVRCKDNWGNSNVAPYTVNFCIAEGPDETVVNFNANSIITIPDNGITMPYNMNDTSLIIYINEPAECKYDSTDIDYDLMSKTMFCNLGPNADYLGKWKCQTNPNENLELAQDSNTVYIKCRDQPWLADDSDGTDNDLRNTNVDSYIYALEKTRTQLKVDTVSLKIGDDQIPLNPFGFLEIKGGGNNFNLDLLARTSGGSESGRAMCNFDFIQTTQPAGSNPPDYTGSQFSDTGTTSHEQTGLNLQDGNYNISVMCDDDLDEDGIGNSATEYGTFNLFVDSTTPIVVRAFHDGGKLKLITDEEAKCAYGISAEYCSSGTVDNGKSMTTGFSKVHQTTWEGGQTYYIKCKDLYDNENSGCSRTIIPNLEVA